MRDIKSVINERAKAYRARRELMGKCEMPVLERVDLMNAITKKIETLNKEIKMFGGYRNYQEKKRG